MLPPVAGATGFGIPSVSYAVDTGGAMPTPHRLERPSSNTIGICMGLVLDATDDQAAAFERDGFLRIEQITTLEEVARLRELYDLVMQDASAFRLKYEAGADAEGALINQVFLPELQQPEMADTTYLRNAKRMAARLLGADED